MKRAKGDRLTGGTNDVNPQWVKFFINADPNITVSPGGTGTRNSQVRFNLPVNRINQSSSSTATIIEILKVRWSFKLGITATTAQPWLATVAGYLTTVGAQSDYDNIQGRGTTLDWYSASDSFQPFNLYTVSPSSAAVPQVANNLMLPIDHDLTDGDGHGVLIATDSVTVVNTCSVENETLAGGGNLTFDSVSQLCEVLYRYKTVTLAEFIGIVQSQEAGLGR